MLNIKISLAKVLLTFDTTKEKRCEDFTSFSHF